MKLYEINAELQKLIEVEDGIFVNYETGEVFNEQAIDDLKLSLAEKKDNICKIIKNNQSDMAEIKAKVDFLKAEIERLNDMSQVIENRNNSLAKYLLDNTPAEERKTLKTVDYTLKFTNSESVEINCSTEALPEDYITKKITWAPDKMALKKALKEGAQVEGCRLVKTQNAKVV